MKGNYGFPLHKYGESKKPPVHTSVYDPARHQNSIDAAVQDAAKPKRDSIDGRVSSLRTKVREMRASLYEKKILRTSRFVQDQTVQESPYNQHQRTQHKLEQVTEVVYQKVLRIYHNQTTNVNPKKVQATAFKELRRYGLGAEFMMHASETIAKRYEREVKVRRSGPGSKLSEGPSMRNNPTLGGPGIESLYAKKNRATTFEQYSSIQGLQRKG